VTADEERQDDQAPAEPEAQEPEAEPPAAPAEEPAAEEAPSSEDADEPATEGEAPADEGEAPAEGEPAGTSDEVAETTAEPAAAPAPKPDDTGAEGEDVGGVIPSAAGEDVSAAIPEPSGGAKKDLPPGAELEPISLEPDHPMGAEERARMEAEAEERARLEAEATADGGEEPLARTEPRVEIAAEALIQATGKRKDAIARVVVRSGSGRFEVNQRPLEEYFPRPHLQSVARQALVTSGYEGNVDVSVRVQGGGVSGQAGAIRHGIARALCEIDADLRPELKRRGLLTRDARIKERRKAGLKKARKRPQFSKR